MNKKIILTIYTDGACSGNPGPGGWGVLLQYGSKEKTLKGGDPNTTNNRMEMMAAIKAIEAVNETYTGEIILDSTVSEKQTTHLPLPSHKSTRFEVYPFEWLMDLQPYHVLTILVRG